MIEPVVAFEKISQFQTADELANFLIGEGVQGRIEAANSCVIAVYLKKTTGYTTYVDALDVGFYLDSGLVEQIDCTEVMGEFIKRFDDGEYPSLIVDDVNEY